MLSVFRWCIYVLAGLCLAGKAVAQFGDIDALPSDFDNVATFQPLPGASWLSMEFPGNLPFDSEISLRSGYDTNIFASEVDPLGSFFSNASLGVLYDFGTPRLKFGTNIAAGITYYYSRPGKKQDYTYDGTVALTYLMSRRVTFQFSNRIAYLTQPDLYIAGTDAQRIGDYLYTITDVSARVILRPRLSTVTRYSISTLTYMDQVYNDQSGRIDQGISQSLELLIRPATTGILEVRVNPVTYYVADLNTVGAYLLAGFQHKFNPRFSWNLSSGLEARVEQNQTDGESLYLGPFLSTALAYQLGERTSMSWSLSYGTEPSGLGFVTTRETFRSGLNLSYGLTAKLTATLEGYYQRNFYDQPGVIPDITEQIFSLTFGLRYQLNRSFSLSAAYQYIQDVAPEAPYQEYLRNTVYGGINFSF